MRFPQSLIEARLLGRRKRFFADMILPSGELVVAHCPNPGSMRGNSEPGAKAWLLDRQGAGGKLRYRWMAVENCGKRVGVDTGCANALVREALAAKKIKELEEFDQIIPEFAIEASRLDFLLWHSVENKSCFVEVKSVSMLAGEHAIFPDSPTSRGQKHLELLTELSLAGERAVLIFLVATNAAQSMGFADWIDPIYGAMVRTARDHGVEIYAYSSKLDESSWEWGEPLPIDWKWRESMFPG